MGWTRKTLRAILRHRRPDIEILEPRELLTASLSHAGKHHGHAVVAALKSRPSPVGNPLGSKSSPPGDLDGAAQARSAYGVDGSGMTVALIDTGIDYHSAALGNGYGSGFKVVAGYDFVQDDGDPYSTSQHGTAVAGLIASSDPGHPGVAPGADLAALRVFGNDSQGSFDNVARALQWVIDNHDKDHITAVNLSLSDPNNYDGNWFAQDRGVGQQITGLVAQLDILNIPVIAATGNNFSGQQGSGFPAIIPETISVTSTDPTGRRLTANAQRLGPAIGGDSATDIAAPGEGIVAAVSGNQVATMEGTSFAAPQVTGAVVLLQQIYESRFGQLPTVAQLDAWLEQGSSPVDDPLTHLSIGRLDISRAASLIPNPQPQVLTPPRSGTSSTASSVPAGAPPPQQQHTESSPTTRSSTGGAHGPGGGASGGKSRTWTGAVHQKDLSKTQPTGQIKSVVRAKGARHLTSRPVGSTRRPAFVLGGRHR